MKIINMENAYTQNIYKIFWKGNKKGFTLAEVLVTLAVIGVIVALTIPGLVKNHQEKVTVTKLKKTFSVMSQATMMINADCGGNVLNCLSDPNAENNDATTRTELANLYKAKLSVIKDCGTTSPGTGCFGNVVYKYLNGADWYNISNRHDKHKLLLNNGTAINLNWDGSADSYGTFRGNIDINGSKPPNQLGRDTFLFFYNPRKCMLDPCGVTSYACQYGLCDSSSNYGGACAARVLKEGAINY